MTEWNGNELELLRKHFIRQFMKDQLAELTGDEEGKDNSFAFLENRTLNMLLLTMMINGGHRTHPEMYDDTGGFSPSRIVEELKQLIKDNKHEFEEIIAILKNDF